MKTLVPGHKYLYLYKRYTETQKKKLLVETGMVKKESFAAIPPTVN